MIVIFDLDGTLADISHRRHFVEKPDKVDADWRAFYAACVDDVPNDAVVAIWRALARDEKHSLWIVSGRSKEVLRHTQQWLGKHEIWPDQLIMREDGDHQPDTKLKQSWLRDGTIPRDEVICVFDDRTSVVEMWRSEGIPCFQVAPGDF